MALTFKQDFTQSTLALAADTGPTLTFSRASNATMFNNVGVMVRQPAARTIDASSYFIGTSVPTFIEDHGPWSASMWARSEATGGANFLLNFCDSGGDQDYYGIETTAGDVFRGVKRDTTLASTSAGTVDTSWHNLVIVVRSQTDLQLYVDGTASSVLANDLTPDSIDQIGLGILARSSTVASANAVDVFDIAIWNRDISTGTDIAELVAGTRPDSVTGGAPEHYWKCDDFTDLIDSGTVGGITLVETSAPAFDYDVPSSIAITPGPRLAAHTVSATFPWINRGVLIEEARTNLCLQSQDFDTTWSAVNFNALTQTETALDLSTTAWLCDDTDTGSNVYLDQTWTPTNSLTYTISIFIKKDLSATAALNMYLDISGATGQYGQVAFDPANGVLLERAGGFEPDDSGFEDLGSWYRVWMTVINDASGNTLMRWRIFPTGDIVGALNGAEQQSPVGSNILWGAQLEVGAFPTSYIPTTTAAVTRAADALNTTDVTWYNNSSGTFAANAWIPQDTVATSYVWDAVETAGRAAATLCYIDSSNNSHAFWNGDLTVDDTGPAVTSEDDEAFTMAYGTTNSAWYLDSTQGGTDATVTFNGTIDFFGVGYRQDDTRHLNGYIKDIRYWNERKPNLWLESPPAMGAENDTRIKYDFSRNTLADAVILGPTPVFDRASNATYFNNVGTLVFAPENRIIQSEDFDTTWTKVTAATVDTNTAVAPDGTTTMDSILDTAGGSFRNIASNTITVPAQTPILASIYVLKDSVPKATRFPVFRLVYTNGSTGTADVAFDTSTGDTGSQAGQVPDNINVEDLTTWWRISWTLDSDTSTTCRMDIYGSAGAGSDLATYSGSATTDGGNPTIVWGAQVEVGWLSKTVADTYVPTTTAALAVPRLASHLYDGTSWSNHGYLTEAERKNLCLQSEDFETTWTTVGSPVIGTGSTAAFTAPDGTTNASSLYASAATTDLIQQNLTLSTSTTYALSIFMKNIDSVDSELRLLDVDGSDNQGLLTIAWTGQTPSTSFSSGFSNIVYEEVGNDWWRISATVASDATNTSHNIRILPDRTTTDKGIYIWGCQFEQGASTFENVPGPSTYIPTTTAAVTRAGDYMYLENSTAEPANELGAYGYGDLNEGSWVAKFTSPIAQNIEDFDNYVIYGTADGFMFIESTDSDLNAYNNAVLDYAGGGGYAIAATTQYEAIIAWEPSIPGSKTLVNDITNETDGSVYGDDDYTGDWELSTIDLGIGNYGTSGIANLNGHIKEVRFWDYQFSDAEMADPPRFSIASGMLLLGVG